MKLTKEVSRSRAEEYAEEAKASFVTVPLQVWKYVEANGLVERPWKDGRVRLTDAGRAALGRAAAKERRWTMKQQLDALVEAVIVAAATQLVDQRCRAPIGKRWTLRHLVVGEDRKLLLACEEIGAAASIGPFGTRRFR